MACFHLGERFTEVIALFRRSDAHRSAITFGSFLLQIVGFEEMAHVVGHVRANIIATIDQFPDRDFRILDIHEQQCLNSIDVINSHLTELITDDIEITSMQSLDQAGDVTI